MAREYRKRRSSGSRSHRRGLKPGHTKSAAWRKAISAGLKRAWRAGKFKGRKHRHDGHKRRSTKTRHNTGSRRKKRTRYLTRDPKTGHSYF